MAWSVDQGNLGAGYATGNSTTSTATTTLASAAGARIFGGVQTWVAASTVSAASDNSGLGLTWTVVNPQALSNGQMGAALVYADLPAGTPLPSGTTVTVTHGAADFHGLVLFSLIGGQSGGTADGPTTSVSTGAASEIGRASCRERV